MSPVVTINITAACAMSLLSEGKKDRRNSVVEDVYPRDTSEHFWWARGWLREDEEISNLEAANIGRKLDEAG